jgi:hypothetical protein
VVEPKQFIQLNFNSQEKHNAFSTIYITQTHII